MSAISPVMSEPISPAEVDTLLQPDPRSRAADLLVLRDALDRMAGALERLASAAGELGAASDLGSASDAPLTDYSAQRPPRGD